MTERLLNIDEVAEFLGLPRQKVKELVDQGTIPAYRIAGSFLRFDPKEIAAKSDLILKAAQKETAKKAVYENPKEASFAERMKDLFYFNDFYIVCAILIGIILVLIFRS